HFRGSGAAIPLAPTLMMDGDLTARTGPWSVGFHVRYLDDRPANEDRSLTARGYTIIDLFANYRWHAAEFSLQFLNIANAKWREAQFSDNSCLRTEIGSAPGCNAAPGQQDMHQVDA